jgi:glyoxylase I family protein
MGLSLDVGLVTAEAAPMAAFYRDVLELPYLGEVTLPGLGVLRKFQCGHSLIKLLAPFEAPERGTKGAGFAGVAGIRYFTLTVADLAASLERCRRAGAPVLVEATTVRPGVMAAMVEDPDGNAVELMTQA